MLKDYSYNVDNYNMKCGFAIITNKSNNYTKLNEYQNKGYEILSHSVNHTSDYSKTGNEEKVISELVNSKATLEENGLTVRGWVTPMSQVHISYIPLVKMYYKYGFTEYIGNSTDTSYTTRSTDKCRLGRYSTEALELDTLKTLIDEAISGNKNICFYGHGYPSSTMTEEKMKGILEYLKEKQDINACKVVLPYQASLGQYSEFEKMLLSK